jgi:hypothetical protein
MHRKKTKCTEKKRKVSKINEKHRKKTKKSEKKRIPLHVENYYCKKKILRFLELNYFSNLPIWYRQIKCRKATHVRFIRVINVKFKGSKKSKK